jgi:hypothetical protein
MSIEDITYLEKNSIRQSYVILIDSKNRNIELYPDPNYYVVNFNVPFKNVIGFDIIDTSIPRTMYSVDKYNNTIYYYIHTDNTPNSFNDVILDLCNTEKYDPTYDGRFKKFIMPFGDYSLASFIEFFNREFNAHVNETTDNSIILEASGLSEPTDITDTIQFKCNYPFIFNMYDSTLAETLGFDLLIKEEYHNKRYTYNEKLTKKIIINNEEISAHLKLYISFNIPPSIDEPNMTNIIIGPGLVCFTGEKYIILRSPEIEEHSFGSLAYTNNNLGIAKFRTNSLGFNDEKLFITKIPIREFHPIGKLSKITFRFETAEKNLYDFKGINHNITLAIFYFEPTFKQNEEFSSILNPNYTNNFNDYKYINAEQEVINESDDDEDDINEDDIHENFSRDNINNYRKMEQKYNYNL